MLFILKQAPLERLTKKQEKQQRKLRVTKGIKKSADKEPKYINNCRKKMMQILKLKNKLYAKNITA